MNGPVTFEVGYEVSEGIYSVNMIWANTGNCEQEAVTDTAERYAKRHGYRVAYVKEICDRTAEENLRRGMPYHMIDEEAERKYDKSLMQ